MLSAYVTILRSRDAWTPSWQFSVLGLVTSSTNKNC